MKTFSFTIPINTVDHVRVVNTLNQVKAKGPSFYHSNTQTEVGRKYTVQTDNTATAFKIGLALSRLLPPKHKLQIN